MTPRHFCLVVRTESFRAQMPHIGNWKCSTRYAVVGVCACDACVRVYACEDGGTARVRGLIDS